ncbi:hypothetical protein K505DRAFT_340332 [Melanomma pulvis-pyrius CBS 109.77]|uniref:Uncharacterized protein n=1 Tax=Melanomma pulvis-pyrius CBS 109.77 TaxID=1314802 RepID=A0A6A6X352_9PLEO|nr:hypothetical protein K505DRAFT_340332 [Melanomma pulvis-pyrius CBS 109.77]
MPSSTEINPAIRPNPQLPDLLTWIRQSCSIPTSQALEMVNHTCSFCTGEFNTEFEWGAIQTKGCPCKLVIGAECIYTVAKEGFHSCLRCQKSWFLPLKKSYVDYEAVLLELREALVVFARARDTDNNEGECVSEFSFPDPEPFNLQPYFLGKKSASSSPSLSISLLKAPQSPLPLPPSSTSSSPTAPSSQISAF